jgi:uncharacterized membrane protein
VRVNLQEYKVLFLVVTAVLALLVASPALQRVLVYPQTEFFSEMWLLGPGHVAEDYPYNITRGEAYSVFLGVANHLGECAYYVVEVKFRNATQSAPDSFNRTASSLEPLYSFNVFVADKESLELPLNFSFDYNESSYNATLSEVRFNSVTLNGTAVGLGGLTSVWDAQASRFFGNLVFELWIYNGTLSAFQYHERYIDLKFNMTV